MQHPARYPRRPARSRRRWGPLTVLLALFLLTVLAGIAAVTLLTGNHDTPSAFSGAQGESQPVPISLDTDGFDAEHLIDDDVFYDVTTMSEADIADFIAQVNAGCQPGRDGTPCLADATFTSEDREATILCPGGYQGSDGDSAAHIIAAVAESCDVNPQVLLVLIQKEQGLLTASGTSLSARDYEAATGYACPDGAACDPQWAGFFRQIYGAASQFQRYRLDPDTYQVSAGLPADIAFSPDPQCGSAPLTAANQATAGLYNYTPYQPNDAVADGGDDCSSWGNWNFYGYFRRFFGDPTPSTP